MKKLALTLLAALISTAMFSQAQINTKKSIIEDFPEKITKVVLSGNNLLDAQVESAVKDRWQVSPFELCSSAEFEQYKTSDDYYFLVFGSGQFRTEAAPGLFMLTLVKGGEKAEGGLNAMYEVVTVPVCSLDSPNGREATFLPAIVDIIQSHVQEAMSSDYKGYGGLGTYSNNVKYITAEKQIVFAESDLKVAEANITDKMKAAKNYVVLDDDEADDLMDEQAEGKIVSYSVYPTQTDGNSYCYNMLIGADDHKLYFYRRYRVDRTSGGPGLTIDDLKKILK